MDRFWDRFQVGILGFVWFISVTFIIRSIVEVNWAGILAASAFLVFIHLPLTWMAVESRRAEAEERAQH